MVSCDTSTQLTFRCVTPRLFWRASPPTGCCIATTSFTSAGDTGRHEPQDPTCHCSLSRRQQGTWLNTLDNCSLKSGKMYTASNNTNLWIRKYSDISGNMPLEFRGVNPVLIESSRCGYRPLFCVLIRAGSLSGGMLLLVLSCLSVPPHVSTRLSMDEFTWNFALKNCVKICWENPC